LPDGIFAVTPHCCPADDPVRSPDVDEPQEPSTPASFSPTSKNQTLPAGTVSQDSGWAIEQRAPATV
jgi:hypothetical protein